MLAQSMGACSSAECSGSLSIVCKLFTGHTEPVGWEDTELWAAPTCAKLRGASACAIKRTTLKGLREHLLLKGEPGTDGREMRQSYVAFFPPQQGAASRCQANPSLVARHHPVLAQPALRYVDQVLNQLQQSRRHEHLCRRRRARAWPRRHLPGKQGGLGLGFELCGRVPGRASSVTCGHERGSGISAPGMPPPMRPCLLRCTVTHPCQFAAVHPSERRTHGRPSKFTRVLYRSVRSTVFGACARKPRSGAA